MKKPLNIKKFLLPNIPYVFIALFATKLGQAWRLAPGMDFSGKALHLMEGFAAAFQSALPSFHPIDLCVGVAAALLIRLIVYVKGKNAKKFRKNLEYGSARWGRPEDIAPYVDPKFENNVILTQTERLMMSNRPKDPKTARNKNVLVVGGSGSGKTRFFIKPNLMQLHSSYVVTDPKGSIAVECGKLMLRNGYIQLSDNLLNVTWLKSVLAYIGFPQAGFSSTDYFPLLPWIFLFATGYFLYSFLQEKGLINRLFGKWKVPGINFLGKHSLIIYMIHQPICYVVAFLVSEIL